MSDVGEERVGDRLGQRYELVEYLGSGSIGEVYRARDHRLEFRDVAVKVLKREMPRDQIARFRREALLAGGISSPHLVSVSDFSTLPDGQSYIVMELLRGVSLEDLLEKEKRLPVDRAARIADGILAGLEAAHMAGVMHRDLKPDNIYIVEEPGVEDHVKVLDFGFARLFSGDAAALDVTGDTPVVMGTVSYMAPEQLRGMRPDHRADLFSVGAVLFRMLTGKLPYATESPGAPVVLAARLRVRNLERPAARLSEVAPELADYPELETVLAGALEGDPERRPVSAGELRRALAVALGGEQPPASSTPGATASRWQSPASGVKNLRLSPPSEVIPAETEPEPPTPASPTRAPRLYAYLAGVVVLAAFGWFVWRALGA